MEYLVGVSLEQVEPLDAVLTLEELSDDEDREGVCL